ncbi:MAG: DUF1804 family protein [Burkholderiales bacterium]|jgi:transposase|nr:DUF1804 family protein [Burkholderiales bacterium]
MAATAQQRSAARGAYVYQRKSVDQIARLVGVDSRTVARWKNNAKKSGDDWDLSRNAYSVSSQGVAAVTAEVLESFMLQFKVTMEELTKDTTIKSLDRAEALSRLTDAYNKAMSAAAKSSPALNKIAVALEVIHDLLEFVKTEMPSHLQVQLEIIEPFGEYISKKYG